MPIVPVCHNNPCKSNSKESIWGWPKVRWSLSITIWAWSSQASLGPTYHWCLSLSMIHGRPISNASKLTKELHSTSKRRSISSTWTILLWRNRKKSCGIKSMIVCVKRIAGLMPNSSLNSKKFIRLRWKTPTKTNWMDSSASIRWLKISRWLRNSN